MNGFQKNSIRSLEKIEKKALRWIRGHILLSLIALALGVLMLRGVVGAIRAGEISVSGVVTHVVGRGVETDLRDHTNILLLGSGGEGHDGENLTDTMIVASIDHKDKQVAMLSIPRDLYIENEVVGWGTRLNSIYEFILDDTGNAYLAMNELIGEIEGILDIDLHYYAKIDFQGFEDVVDALDGVEVTLEEALYDPYYPAPVGSDNEYEIFSLPAGNQILDGETALKYVRSRKTSSDFDRSRRQQEVITAIKNKALSLGVLLNPSKLKNLYFAISANFETDLTIAEMLKLADFAKDLDRDGLHSQVISDEAWGTAGFLYTPDREIYGGAYVLIPYLGEAEFDELSLFAETYLYHPELLSDPVPLQILNGTEEESLAGLTKMHLQRYGFTISNFGNAASENVQETRIILRPQAVEDGEEPPSYDLNDTVEALSLFLQGTVTETIPEEYSYENWDTEAEIIVELGQDFVDSTYTERENWFYVGFY